MVLLVVGAFGVSYLFHVSARDDISEFPGGDVVADGQVGVGGAVNDAAENTQQPQLTVEETPEPPAIEEPPVNLAPQFRLPRIDGQDGVVDLASYRGEKPVIIDFFAPHCPNCRRNITTQKPLYEKYKDQLEIIIIGIDPEPQNSRYFQNNPVAMPVVYDATQQVLRNYQIRFTNTHAFISRDGSLLGMSSGDLTEEDILFLLSS